MVIKDGDLKRPNNNDNLDVDDCIAAGGGSKLMDAVTISDDLRGITGPVNCSGDFFVTGMFARLFISLSVCLCVSMFVCLSFLIDLSICQISHDIRGILSI